MSARPCAAAGRFIRDDEEDAAADDPWAVRLARRYYAKLYREYAVVDLTRYKVRDRHTKRTSQS
jgi:hypothetical protein